MGITNFGLSAAWTRGGVCERFGTGIHTWGTLGVLEMRLGRIEKSILLAVLNHGRIIRGQGWSDTQIFRDELPHLIFGWKKTTIYHRGFAPYRDEHYEYRDICKSEYMSRQASLTRSLQSLFLKGFIDCGSSSEASGLRIYSGRRAKAHGIEPKKPFTDRELNEVHGGGFIEGLPVPEWTMRGQGYKPRHGRNIKSIRLTEKGIEKAKQLNVK